MSGSQAPPLVRGPTRGNASFKERLAVCAPQHRGWMRRRMLRTAPVAEARRPRPARPRQKPAYASLAKGQALRGARGPGASASHVECKAARSMAMPRFLSAARSLHSAPMTLGCDGPRPWPSPQAAPSPRRRDFLKHGCLTSPRRKFGPPSALRSKTPRPPAARAVKRAFKRKASRPSRCPPPLLLSRPCGGPSPLVPPRTSCACGGALTRQAPHTSLRHMRSRSGG